MAGEQGSGATEARQGFGAGFGRRWRWIAGASLAALIGSAVFVIAVPPRYAGVAKVLLDEPRTAPRVVARGQAFPGLDRAASGGGAPSPDLTEPAIEAESLATPDLAHAAVLRLGLVGAGAPDGDAVEAFLSRLTIAPSPGSRTATIAFVAARSGARRARRQYGRRSRRAIPERCPDQSGARGRDLAR